MRLRRIDMELELSCPLRGSMRAEHTAAHALRQAAPDRLRRSFEKAQNVLRARGQQNFLLNCEEGLEPRPSVGNQGRTASGRVEEANAGAESGPQHVGAREVQRKTAGAVKGRMLSGRDMVLPRDIRRPVDTFRIERSSDNEREMGRTARGLDQQAFERRLPIGRIRAEIAEVIAGLGAGRPIDRWIDRAVEGDGGTCAEIMRQSLENGPAGEREIKVVTVDEIAAQIFAAVEIAERHGRIDVVEGDDTSRMFLHEASDRDSFRHIGPDDYGSGLRDFRAKPLKLGERTVEDEPAKFGFFEIAMRCIPRDRK